MIMETLQNFVNGFGIGISKEDLVLQAYYFMKAQGYECYTISDNKYLGVNDVDYKFIRSKAKNCWTVKEVVKRAM